MSVSRAKESGGITGSGTDVDRSADRKKGCFGGRNGELKPRFTVPT